MDGLARACVCADEQALPLMIETPQANLVAGMRKGVGPCILRWREDRLQRSSC